MISTGLKKLDEFFSGGIPNGIVVDIFGGNSTGKTQLALQLTKNSIKNGGNVLFFDTTGGFRPERILQIKNNYENPENFLKHITVSRITNTFEQIKSLENLQTQSFSLIVIDNVTDLFSFEYKKIESMYEKNSLFMKYLHKLSQHAIKNQIPVILTNMIRNVQKEEFENMKNAIDPFTHIKIHLSKNPKGYKGEVFWGLGKEKFSYLIDKNGLIDLNESRPNNF